MACSVVLRTGPISHPRIIRIHLFPIPVSEPIPADDPVRLHDYLKSQRNCQADIRKLNSILAMQHIILEIGCGSCEIARQIAGRNPGWGVIATDLYDSDEPGNATGSRYQRVAGSWKTRGLASQQLPYGNLVVLRARIEILGLLPYGCVDSVLVVNAEPKVGKSIVGELYGKWPLPEDQTR